MDGHLKQIFDTEIQFNQTPIGVTAVKAILELDKLANGQAFVSLLKYKDLEVEYYKPDKIDLQKPHTRDEIYVIHRGSGSFEVNQQVVTFKENDVLFVKAHDEHRFINFTDDFATWVIFYGSTI